MAKRKLNFPPSLLVGSARIHDATVDSGYAVAVAARLHAPGSKLESNFTSRFAVNLDAGDAGAATQKLKITHAGTLTEGQDAALDKAHLLAGGRRSARRAFLGHPVKLYSEFQVGITDANMPEAELARGKVILGSCSLALTRTPRVTLTR